MRNLVRNASAVPRAVVTAAVLLSLPGCTAWGNLIVLAVTVGIFFGTLSLGRRAESNGSGADTSTSSRSGH